MPNNLSLDPLEIVNTTNDPISDAINNVLPKNMSTVAQSGVEGMNTGGVVESEEVVEQPMNYSPIRTETTQSHSAEQYQQQQARLDALIASGKDPSKFDINGAPLGTYGGQVSAQDYMSSIAKPREVNEEYYTPEDYINLLKSDELGSTEYSGNTVINYKALPEGGYGSFITAGGGDLGFSINEQGLTKEQAKSIFNNYVNEVGGELQLGNMLGVGGIGAKGDMVQRDDGTWTFKFEDPSFLNQFGDVVGALSMAALTYATGAALLPAATAATTAAGLQGATATGVAQAATSAVAQQVVTGEIDPVKVVLSGLDGALNVAEASDLEKGIEAADALETYGQYSAEYAEAVSAANDAQATYEVLNHAQTAIDITKAIEDKNVLQAIDLTESLMDSSTLYTSVQDNFVGVIPDEYVTRATNAVIEAGDELINGGDAVEVVQGLTNEILIDTVANPEAIAERFGLSNEGWGNTAAQTISEMTTKVLEGDNREEILSGGFKSFLDNIPESEKESPEFMQNIEKYWHDNVEQPLEDYWQQIEPLRKEYENLALNAVNTVKNVGQQVIDTADAAVRAAPTTKEDWQEAEDWYHENIEDPAEEFVQGLSDDDDESTNYKSPDVDVDVDIPSYSLGSIGNLDLDNIEFRDSELIEGFEYAPLYNPLRKSRVI